MIARLRTFWAARDARERLILRGGAAFVMLILVPFLIYQSAARYRADAAANLASAQSIMADVRTIKKSAPPPAAIGDGGVRGVATANAGAMGLGIVRIEPVGGDRLLIVFGASDSIGVYRWVDSVGRAGATIHRSAIARAGDGGAVTAEFEIGSGK